MMKRHFLFSFFCLSLLIACDSGETASSSNTSDANATVEGEPSTTTQTEEKTMADQEDLTVIAWVDQLNIRQQPNMKSQVVAQAKENERLLKTGEQSDFTETIELRGKSYTEPWIQVKTAAGKIGWVFGGALKKEGEDKGNALNTAQRFSYPHFGDFNLNEWTKNGTRDDSSEEVDASTNIYTKGTQSLEISNRSMGEMSWGKSYTLKDANGKVLKERSIRISAVNDNTLTESVRDYTRTPPVEYSRNTVLNKHFSQINPKPDMASGEWKMSELREN
ncbi:MAG: SH3 domain-containing protein [Bacteroidota bacterium]